MKPTGSAAAKKSRSGAVRRSPEQPKTTASGALSGNYAPDVAPFQLGADPLCIRYRGGLEAVKHTLVAKIGTNGRRRDISEQVWIRAPDTIPLLMRVVLAAHRSELDPGAAGLLRRSWFCSSGRSGFGLNGRFAGQLLRLGLWRRIGGSGCGRRRWRLG